MDDPHQGWAKLLLILKAASNFRMWKDTDWKVNGNIFGKLLNSPYRGMKKQLPWEVSALCPKARVYSITCWNVMHFQYYKVQTNHDWGNLECSYNLNNQKSINLQLNLSRDTQIRMLCPEIPKLECRLNGKISYNGPQSIIMFIWGKGMENNMSPGLP